MTIFLIVKLLIVVIFLVIFLRRPSLVWGIGLLTVTTAVLLDTFLGTFGRDEMLAELGFFYPVVAGMLFTGAAVWLWSLLRPLTAVSAPVVATTATAVSPSPTPRRERPAATPDSAFDRQMIYDQIRQRFGRDDVLDLMFDLNIGENEVMTLNQDMDDLILNVMDIAEEREQTAALALAVERILTPPPPEHLPRLEKINVSSPPTILRQYLLAHYNLQQLTALATALALDSEQIGSANKKTWVREFLLYLYRRNRIDELINLMQQSAASTAQ
ncbi:MAG: hypothetical protein R3E31_04170 [Chloroflexota bacterium]